MTIELDVVAIDHRGTGWSLVVAVISRTCVPSAFAIASLLPEPWPEVKAICSPIGCRRVNSLRLETPMTISPP